MGFTLYDDDDNLYFKYENMDDWHNGDTTNFYNGGAHSSRTGVTSRVTFTMNGTIFRLYCQTYTGGRNTNIKVIVDGIHVDTINAQQWLQNGHALFYTSPTFSYGDHNIILEHDGAYTGQIMFDGIDTDGFLRAQLGSVFLPVAPPGWKRIDNTDTGFLLNGTWSKTTESPQWGGYKNTWSWSTTAGDSILFILKSSKLRIYTYGWSDTSGYDLYIDGVFINRINTNFGNTNSLLSYENLNLSADPHIIQMVIKDKSLFPGSTTTRILLDCIDIDQQGELNSLYKQLPSPDTNWTRYDGSDINVILNNMKILDTGDMENHMNGNVNVTDDPSIPSSIKIKTSGSKIRLISPVNKTTNKNVIVKVDGNIIDTFSTLDINMQGKILYYETPELIHTYDKYVTVEFIYPDEDSNAFFDCFDIYNGDLLQNPIDIENTNSNVVYEYTNLASNKINIDAAGIYAIECWGANGGGNKNRPEGSSGGWGGYSYGEVHFDIDDVIYCTPGGQGVLATANFNGGGFNGGGHGGFGGFGGGGGTDVRYKINDITHRIIVAGGGGGADNVGSASTGGDDGSGGHGGGLIAQGAFISGSHYQQYGATQISGYSLGVGQSVTVATDTGGAGGGYYGGFVTNNNNGGAGGGSGYIGNLNNAYTVSGVWWGNGKVKITLLQKDKEPNFQHYAIESDGKFIIPNASHFDTIKEEFIDVSEEDLFNCNEDLSMYVINVNDIFKSFVIGNKQYSPYDYIKGLSNIRIMKITADRDSIQEINNYKYHNIIVSTDFTKIDKTMIIKMKNYIKLKTDILNNLLKINEESLCKIAIEYNSMLFGDDLIRIQEDDIINNGFSPYTLNKIDIPFDNIKLVFCLTKNVKAENEKLQYFKIIQSNNNLRKLLNHNEYTLILKLDDNKIYLKILNDTIKTLIVNKLEKENIEYRVKDTLNTF